MTDSIRQAAELIARSRSGIALTGAGISVESGIPPFRGRGGLWEKIDPMKYAHIDAYVRNPQEVWRVLFSDLDTVLRRAQPNDGHRGLYELEQMGIVRTIITQNIDGLHQRAGSRDVLEFHGTFAYQRCMQCDARLASDQVSLDRLPPKCRCGGTLRPDVVMFGEIIAPDDLQRAQLLSSTCDLMLVVGTSATVQPAAYLPVIAKHAGAVVVEVNPDSTSLSPRISDVTLLGAAGPIMTELVNTVKQLV
jgi:NAD-dependent deacetylase